MTLPVGAVYVTEGPFRLLSDPWPVRCQNTPWPDESFATVALSCSVWPASIACGEEGVRLKDMGGDDILEHPTVMANTATTSRTALQRHIRTHSGKIVSRSMSQIFAVTAVFRNYAVP